MASGLPVTRASLVSPHPHLTLTWQWLSIADSVCQQLWGSCSGPRWGARGGKMEHLLGCLGPARETDPAPVWQGSAQTQGTVPQGTDCLLGVWWQRDGFLETETQAGLCSPAGGQTPQRHASILEVIRAVLGARGSPGTSGAVVDTQWTRRSGWFTLLSILPDSEGLPWA